MVKKIILAAAMGLLAAARGASADPNFLFKNLCSPSLHACAGVQVFTTPTATGGTAVVVKVRNLEGVPGTNAQPARIGGVVLQGKPAAGAMGAFDYTRWSVSTQGHVGYSQFGPQPSSWFPYGKSSIPSLQLIDIRLDNDVQGGTFGDDGIGGCTPVAAGYTDSPIPNGFAGDGGHQTCGPGLSWVVFAFNTDGSWLAQDVDIGVLFVLGPRQQYDPYFYPDNCGPQFYSHSANPQPCNEISASYATTPEPVTLALLSTGLLGIAGARRPKPKGQVRPDRPN